MCSKRKEKKRLGKAIKLKVMNFDKARTNIMAKAMTRRYYIMTKIKVSKINETPTALKANYDHHSPTNYYDVLVFQQLSNDLSTQVMGIFVMEVEFSESAATKKQVNQNILAK